MNHAKEFCKNPGCKVKNTESLHEENLEELYGQAVECDSCFQAIMELEENTFQAVHHFRESIFSSPAMDKPFQEELDLETATRFENLPNKEFPLYLKNFMEMSFQTSKQENADSLVLKIAKEGMKFLSAAFSGSQMELQPVLMPRVRSKEKEMEEALNIKESLKNEDIIYQVIRENEEEAYLCINFMNGNKQGYHQVNLKKNNRFIYSSQINERGVVSFSGLKEGKYSIEFVGKNSSKAIDLTILVDHN